MPQGFPPGVLPPMPAPIPAIPTTPEPAKPRVFAGTVRVQIFSEVIATGGEAAKILDD